MTTVRNQVVDVGGAAEEVTVRVRLRATAGWLDGRQETVADGVETETVGGRWQLELLPTSQYEDPGAYYEVREGRTVYAITVPDDGEHWVGSLLVTSPAASPPLFAAVLVLDVADPVPAGTPAGTVILRH